MVGFLDGQACRGRCVRGEGVHVGSQVVDVEDYQGEVFEEEGSEMYPSVSHTHLLVPTV